MKNKINRTTTVLVGLAAITVGLASPQTSVASGLSVYDWEFSTGASPVGASGVGTAQATIAPGQFASGWMADNDLMGDAQGIWDLGRNGTITLNNPAGLVGDSGQARLFTLRVAQYQDGGIYRQLATVSVPGAAPVTSTAVDADLTAIGGWVVQETKWSAPAGAAVNTIIITSAFDGSLVDSVTLLPSGAVVQAPQLAIRRAGPNNSQVQISWSANYSNMVLESSADLTGSQGWTQVTAQAQVSGDTASVTLDAAGSASFYRLRQP